MKWFRKNDQGYFVGLVDDDMTLHDMPKQHFEDVYIPDGYVDVVRASYAVAHDSLYGDHIHGYESPICGEVDSMHELNIIRYQLMAEGSALLDYLKQHYPQEQAD